MTVSSETLPRVTCYRGAWKTRSFQVMGQAMKLVVWSLASFSRSSLAYQTVYSLDGCCFSFWNKLIWQGNINSALSCWESCVHQEIFVHLPWLSSQGRMWKVFLIQWLKATQKTHAITTTKQTQKIKPRLKKRNAVCRRTLHSCATGEKTPCLALLSG